jgi:hypothetical protein
MRHSSVQQARNAFAFLVLCLITTDGPYAQTATAQVELQIQNSIVEGQCPDALVKTGPQIFTIANAEDCQGLVGHVPRLDNVEGVRALIERYANALYSGDAAAVTSLWVQDRQPLPDVRAVHNGCGLKDLDDGKFEQAVRSLATGLANVSTKIGVNPYRAQISSIVPGVYAKVRTNGKVVTGIEWKEDAFFVEGDQVIGCSRGLVAKRHIHWTLVNRGKELRFADVKVQ